MKAKQGELRALKDCADDVRESVYPILDLPRAQHEIESESGLRSHVQKALRQIRKVFGSHDLFALDFFDLRLSLRLPGGVHPVKGVFTELSDSDIWPTPCTGLDRDAPYQQAVREVLQTSPHGLCVRLLWDDLETPAITNPQLEQLLSYLDVDRQDVDLIFDLRNISKTDVTFASTIISYALQQLAGINQYRRLILTAHSLPQAINEAVAAGASGYVERKEWGLWKAVLSTPSLPRYPIYGDYGVVSPDYSDLAPEIINSVMAPKVRYALENSWFVGRGKSFKTHPDGYNQYYSLADAIVALPDFCGHTFSYGDSLIAMKATRSVKPGSPAQWVTIDSNHHYSFVVNQLARVSNP